MPRRLRDRPSFPAVTVCYGQPRPSSANRNLWPYGIRPTYAEAGRKIGGGGCGCSGCEGCGSATALSTIGYSLAESEEERPLGSGAGRLVGAKVSAAPGSGAAAGAAAEAQNEGLTDEAARAYYLQYRELQELAAGSGSSGCKVSAAPGSGAAAGAAAEAQNEGLTDDAARAYYLHYQELVELAAGSGASGCKVSAAPGSGASAEVAAGLQNAGVTDETAREAYQQLFGDHTVGCEHYPDPPDPACPACASRFDGTAGECPSPCLDLQSTADFESLDLDEAARHVVIHDANSSEEELLLTAWAILLANQDVMEWVLCWLYGAGGGDCYLNRLNRTSSRVEIKVTDSRAGCKHDFTGGADLTGGYIKVCCTRDAWIKYTRIFASSAVEDRMCSAIDLAATLFHELTHVCWRSPDDTSCTCQYSYMIENLFRWAIMQRYPDATASDCCEYAASMDDLNEQWGRSCTTYPSSGCL